MGIFEIILVGIGLSMDACAVSMTNGMVYKNLPKSKMLLMPILFGLLQGLMPLIGYYAGGIFSDVISKYAPFLVFIILGVIGGKMLKDGLSHKNEDDSSSDKQTDQLTYKTLVLQAIATSIDAFAVGIAFSALKVNILPAVILIAMTTALLSFIALFIGRQFGDLLESKSEILGGAILILIAIKALFS